MKRIIQKLVLLLALISADSGSWKEWGKEVAPGVEAEKGWELSRELIEWLCAGHYSKSSCKWPVGGADCQQDLRPRSARLMCPELWSCKSSAVCARLSSVGWDSGSQSTDCTIIDYVFVTHREPQKRLLPPWCLPVPGWSVEWCLVYLGTKKVWSPERRKLGQSQKQQGPPTGLLSGGSLQSAEPWVWDSTLVTWIKGGLTEEETPFLALCTGASFLHAARWGRTPVSRAHPGQKWACLNLIAPRNRSREDGAHFLVPFDAIPLWVATFSSSQHHQDFFQVRLLYKGAKSRIIPLRNFTSVTYDAGWALSYKSCSDTEQEFN